MLEKELGVDLAHMPFAYGLAKASRGVLMILDHLVTPLRRIWCLYEVQRASEPWHMAFKCLLNVFKMPFKCLLSLEKELQKGMELLLDADLLEVADSLQSMSAHGASASVFADKLSIWREILNPSVKAAFPLETFKGHFEAGECRIRGLLSRRFARFATGFEAVLDGFLDLCRL